MFLIGSWFRRLFRWAIMNLMASVMLLSEDVESNSTLSRKLKRAAR